MSLILEKFRRLNATQEETVIGILVSWLQLVSIQQVRLKPNLWHPVNFLNLYLYSGNSLCGAGEL